MVAPLGFIAVLFLAIIAIAYSQSQEFLYDDIDYGNHHLNWEDGTTSWDEFGHDNSPDMCNLPILTVEEWEAGKYWERDQPAIVRNVTKGWAALHSWKLQEIVKRYPDIKGVLKDGRPRSHPLKNLEVTLAEFISKYMYNPFEMFFLSGFGIFGGNFLSSILEDNFHPLPMPLNGELDHNKVAVFVGADLQGGSFHHHEGSAFNTVIFGKKRWILYSSKREREEPTRRQRIADVNQYAAATDGVIANSSEWMRQLYPDPYRNSEIRRYGYDCIQHAGDMMFVPKEWLHMVVNIGDTVGLVVSYGRSYSASNSADLVEEE